MGGRVWGVLFIVYTVLLFALGSVSTGGAAVEVDDKLLHALAFAGECALCLGALSRVAMGWASRLAWSVGVSALVGGALELWQATLPHRRAEVADFVADAVGAAVFALFAGAVRWYGRRGGSAVR